MKRILALVLFAGLFLPALAASAQTGGVTTTADLADEDQRTAYVDSSLGTGLGVLGVGIGLGLIIMGAGKGIGNIGGHAADAIARQPEAGGRIFTTMIISAALIEGATLFALVVAFIK